MTFLTLKDISKKVYGQGVLESVNYDFSNNTISWIRGNVGSGKTLLSNIIGRIENPDTGSSNWNDLFEQSIGFVFDVPGLINNLNISQNLALAMDQFQKSNKHRVHQGKSIHELLAEWGLETIEQLRPVSLSKGQAIKVALIRALIFNPKVLIWDDAFECFDEADFVFVQKRLEALHESGCALILLSRRPNIHWNYPSQELFLENGRLRT
jgi:ABC-type lipoprotein export system ATPase subunit